MERPTLRQLEILAEVARAGTFRGAARHLGLSQVAVSDHIRQLESRLGCALFVRNAGGKPTLSPSGKIVLEHGRNVLFACDALISAARVAADGVVAPVVMIAEPELPPVLLDYAADLDGLAVVEPDGELGATEPPGIEAAQDEVSDVSTATSANVVVAPHGGPVPAVEFVPVSLLNVMRNTALEKEGGALAPELAPAVQISVPESVLPSIGTRSAQTETVSEKHITVASHPAILSRFQDKLAAAQEAFPDRPIAVDFARFTPEAVVGLLAAGQVDIALFYALGEVAGMPSEYLWSESWSLFARADHPLAQADMLRLVDCVDMPMILFEEVNPLRALSEACLVKAGLWPSPTVLETDDFAAIATELLEYGEAVFPAFGVTAAQFAAKQGLKRLALVEPLPGVQVRRAIALIAEDDPTIAALAGLLG
ncbi:MAG TPA: LysR family transcriptional regulator [Sphingobium sp.]